MSFFRVALVACSTLLATIFSSAAFAGCCGGCGGCGAGGYVVMTYAPAPVQYAAPMPMPIPAPVAPLPIAPAPIAVDHWDTGGWGGGWGNWGGGGCWGGCGCNRGLFTSRIFRRPSRGADLHREPGPAIFRPRHHDPVAELFTGRGGRGSRRVSVYRALPLSPRIIHATRTACISYYWHHRHPLHTRG